MSWEKWVIVLYFAAQALYLFYRVNKPRPAITPTLAVCGAIEFTVIAILAVHA